MNQSMSGRSSQIATLRWADVGCRAFGSLARRRNPTLAHRNSANWRHVGPTVGSTSAHRQPKLFTTICQPFANLIQPLSNVGPTLVVRRSDRWPDVGTQRWPIVIVLIGATLARRSVRRRPNVSQNYLQPFANLIQPLSNVGPTSVKTIYNHVPT